MATGAPGVDAGKRTGFDVESDPVGQTGRDQLELAHELWIGCVANGGRWLKDLASISDEAVPARFIAGDLGRLVGEDIDVDALQRAGLAAKPRRNRLEIQRLARGARGHAKRSAADERLGFREPHVLAGGCDHLAVDQPERPQPDECRPVAGAPGQGRCECVVVHLHQAAERARPAGRHRVVARDHREQPGEIALLGRRAIPAVDEIVSGDRIAVGERGVVPDMKGVVDEPVGGKVGRSDGEVGDLVQRLVEFVEAGEDVTQDVDVCRRRHLRRIQVGHVLRDGEAERLVLGEHF